MDKLKELALENVYMNFDQLGIESSYYPLNKKSYMPNDYQKINFIKHLVDNGYQIKFCLVMIFTQNIDLKNLVGMVIHIY